MLLVPVVVGVLFDPVVPVGVGAGVGVLVVLLLSESLSVSSSFLTASPFFWQNKQKHNYKSGFK